MINNLATKNPHALELLVVYCIDDEGNNYHKVVYAPSIGVFDGDEQFTATDKTNDTKNVDTQANAVCLN